MSQAVNKKRASVTEAIHLWLGLVAGAVLVLAGLTGSYLAFYVEIERALIPGLDESPGVRPSSLEALYQAFRSLGPERKGVWNIEVPRDGGVVTARFSGTGQPVRMVSIDPRDFRVVRDVSWGSSVSTWLYELHYRMLMGRPGATVMGIVGLLILIMLITGVARWWTLGRNARGRLTFTLSGPAARRVYDLHRALGLAFAALLVLLTVTATAMSLPRQFRPVLELFAPINSTPRLSSRPSADGTRITVDEAVEIAYRHFPDAELTWVQVPNTPDGAYAVRFRQPGEPGKRFPRTYVWVDQYSGDVLAVQNGLQGTSSDRILAWLYPLHSGDALGRAGRTLVCVAGFVPALLYFTGFIRWRHKRRARSSSRPTRQTEKS